MATNNAGAASEALASQQESVLRYLFPAGVIFGSEFCIGSLQGESGKSLKIQLAGEKAGIWQDFATGEKGGDLLDLWAQSRCGGNIKEALGDVQDWLGDMAPAPKEKGTPAGDWTYCDAQGQPWIRISRQNLTRNRKVFYQYDIKAKRAISSGGHQLPIPRPLYNLDLLQAADQTVLFVEGEKVADCLTKLGFIATTTIGGSQSPHKTDFAPLAAKTCLIWRDNDKAGNKYAQQVYGLILASGGQPVILSTPEGKPEKWDAYDAVTTDGWQRAEVLAFCAVPHSHSNGASAPQIEIYEEDSTEEKAAPLLYPCPEKLWRGPFAQVAEVTGVRNWETWLGTFCAIAALAHRHIEARYHGRLCGNVYGLLIKPTGTGKRLCTDVCSNLLPPWYMQTGTVSSGPGLLNVLADIERDKKGKVIKNNTHPVILILPEWTSQVKYMRIQLSSLSEDFNNIFDCPNYHSRSVNDRDKSGGHVKISLPTLSILGTTSDKLLKAYVTDEMIFSGFMNRYLILPGSLSRWEYYREDQASMDYNRLLGLLDLPQSPHDVFGERLPLRQCYTPEAWEWTEAWGKPFFEGMMNADGEDAPMTERLHVYAHKVALLYAWAEHAQHVEVEHAEAAKIVCETSAAFLQNLASETDVNLPPNQRYEIDLHKKVIDRIRQEPGKNTVRRLSQRLRKSATGPTVRRIVSALLAGREIEERDNRLFPSQQAPK